MLAQTYRVPHFITMTFIFQLQLYLLLVDNIIAMNIPSDISIVDYWGAFDTDRDPSDHFDHTHILLQDSSGAYYYTDTDQRVDDEEEIILTNLTMTPIRVERMYPTYHKNLLRAQDSILPSCYIKGPVLSNYRKDLDPQTFPNLMMAEIEAYEILRKSPHPNIAKYHGCVVAENGTIQGICITPYEKVLVELVYEDPFSIDIQGCVNGIRKGLEHLHGLGLAHNDLNPTNIMMSNGQPVIIDFDSCVKEGSEPLKRGTYQWSLDNMKVSSRENDYYGLGLIEKWLIETRQEAEADRLEKIKQ